MPGFCSSWDPHSYHTCVSDSEENISLSSWFLNWCFEKHNRARQLQAWCSAWEGISRERREQMLINSDNMLSSWIDSYFETGPEMGPVGNPQRSTKLQLLTRNLQTCHTRGQGANVYPVGCSQCQRHCTVHWKLEVQRLGNGLWRSLYRSRKVSYRCDFRGKIELPNTFYIGIWGKNHNFILSVSPEVTSLRRFGLWVTENLIQISWGKRRCVAKAGDGSALGELDSHLAFGGGFSLLIGSDKG